MPFGRCLGIAANMRRNGPSLVRSRLKPAVGARCSQLRSASRARPGLMQRPDGCGPRAVSRAGAREPRTAPGPRDPAPRVGVSCRRRARPPAQAMIAFVDDHGGVYGVEPICRVLPTAPSTDHALAALLAGPGKLSARARRDVVLKADIRRVFEESFSFLAFATYGASSAGKGSASLDARSRDQCGRRAHEARYGAARPGPRSAIQRLPVRLYVAFIIDACARCIVGGRVSRTAHASFVLDALELALAERHPVHGGGLVHHSGRRGQYGPTTTPCLTTYPRPRSALTNMPPANPHGSRI